MTILAVEMPKDPKKISVQAHLTPEEYKEYHAHALEKQWSDKKLTENVIRWYLEEIKKNFKEQSKKKK